MWRRVSLLNRCACVSCPSRTSLTICMMAAHCSRSLSRLASVKRLGAIMSLWRKKASGMGSGWETRSVRPRRKTRSIS